MEDMSRTFESIIRENKNLEENIMSRVVENISINSIKVKKYKNNDSKNERIGFISVVFKGREYNIHMDLWKVDKYTYYIYADDFDCINLSTDSVPRKKSDNNIFIKDIENNLVLAQSDFASNLDLSYLLSETLHRLENRIEIRLEEMFSPKVAEEAV